jgi:hypothetical protein
MAEATRSPDAVPGKSAVFPVARAPSNAGIVAGAVMVGVLVLLLLLPDTLPVFIIGLIVA